VFAAKEREARRALPALVKAVKSMPGVQLAIKPHPAETPEVYAALAHLDLDDAERLAVLMPRIDRAFDQMHERFADRLIQTVEAAAPS